MEAAVGTTSGMDARIAKSRTLALDTAQHILMTVGLPGFTHRNIALESGLSRATIYRHWPELTDLMLDVMATYSMPEFVKIKGDLRELLRYNLDVQTRNFFDPDCAQVFAAVGYFSHDPRVTEQLNALYLRRVMSLRNVLMPYANLTVEQAEELLSLILGPTRQMFARRVFGASSMFTEATVDACISYIQRVTGGRR